MQSDMAKIDIPYVQTWRSGGRQYAYYRRAGNRHVLPTPVGGPAFTAAYNRIHAQYEGTKTRQEAILGSFSHVRGLYEAGGEYQQLGQATKEDYQRYLNLLERGDPSKKLEPLRDYDMATLNWVAVKRIRSLYSATPRKAEFLRQLLSILCEVAIEEGIRTDNPTRGRKRLKQGEGHRPWEEAEVEQYQAYWQGPCRERVAFELALNSGQRRGDCIIMGRPHYQKGKISVVQEKTKNRVWMPASQALREVLDPYLATHDQMTLLVAERGQPFTKAPYSKFIRGAIRAAGLPDDCTMHGLRYTAATRVAELMASEGYTDEMAWDFVASITGHDTAEMARKYSSKKRKATMAIERLDNANRHKVSKD